MIGNMKNLDNKQINHPDAKDAFMRVLVGGQEGWDDYVMRVITLEPNGYTPRHQHDWAHINYVIDGEGTIMIDGKDTDVAPGAYAFVPGNTIHQYKQRGDKPFTFMCIVKKEGHKT
jgi:quercetin dioxygenase-like cupin family protein